MGDKLTLVILYLASYLLGSIPFGLIVGLLHGVDIRKVGSGNIGATNAYRALGNVGGAITFILDVGKGLVPPLVTVAVLGPQFKTHEVITHSVFVGATAVLGHSFSPFLNFKGGKGVATGLGVLLGVAPIVGISGFATFILVTLLSRYVSIASICACIVVVLSSVITHQLDLKAGV